MTHDVRQTTPRVWHKLATGELKTRKQRYLHDLTLLTSASVKGNGAAMLHVAKTRKSLLARTKSPSCLLVQ